MNKTRNISKHEEFIIPELEEIAKIYIPNRVYWTPREEGILLRYWNKCDIKVLAKYLPGRTVGAIETHYSKMMRKSDAERKEND